MYRLVGTRRSNNKFGIVVAGSKKKCISKLEESKSEFDDLRVEKVENSLESVFRIFGI